MRSDQNNLRSGTANLRLDIVKSFSLQLISVATRMQSSAGKGIFDEVGRRIELRIMQHVSLADLTSQCPDVSTQFFTQRDFFRRQRRRVRNISARHSHSKPPE